MRKGIHPTVWQQWLRHKDVCLYLGHSNRTICSLLSLFCSIIFSPSWSLYWGVQFLITPERKLDMTKKIHVPKSEWDTGVSVPRALKLDHLQPVRLIFFQKLSTLLSIMLGVPISHYPRGWKWEKRIHSKMDEKQEFQYLRHSNWTISNLWCWFCPKNVPPSWALCWELPFLFTPEGEKEKKGFTQKLMRHRGLPGAFKLDHLQPFKLILL